MRIRETLFHICNLKEEKKRDFPKYFLVDEILMFQFLF